MIRIRVASGLGDSVYLRAIAEHFVRRGERVVALSNYPEIFAGSPCEVEPFRRLNVDLAAHYVLGQGRPGTTQWEDVCLAAGVAEPVPFRFSWRRQNDALIARVREASAGRPVVLVHGGRTPMGRTDGFGRELLPLRAGFDVALAALGGAFTVRIGREQEEYPTSCDLDLWGETSAADLLDLFQDCDGVLCQCSFAIPMAEVFDRPLLAVWASAGLTAAEQWTRLVTPGKVLSKRSSGHVMDNQPAGAIADAARSLVGARLEAAA